MPRLLKKVFSIVLLSLLVFNWVGYHLLVFCLQETANAKLETQLDKDNYDERQLISIKIPVTYLPYYNNSKSYERVDGQMEIEGVKYKYVKRRIYNDSLEMLCVPDRNSMKLLSAKNEFFKFVNDLQHPGQNKNPSSGLSKNITTDYEPAGENLCIDHVDFRVSLQFHYLIHITSAHRKLPERPPKYS
jgi:hypothetical protein